MTRQITGQVRIHKLWMKVVNFIKNPLSSKTTFIKNHFHQKPLSSKTTFIKNHFHQKPLSSKTTFIKNHFHQKPLSSKTTFIKNHFHQKPLSSKNHFHQKTTFIKNHFHQKTIGSSHFDSKLILFVHTGECCLLCFFLWSGMDENRGPGGVDTVDLWSTPSFCPMASRSLAFTEAGDAQPFSRVFLGFCASHEVQGGQRHESGASRGCLFCIGRPRIDGEGSITRSSSEGKDGGKSCQTSPRTSSGGRRSWLQSALDLLGHDSPDAKHLKVSLKKVQSRAVSCSTVGRTFEFLSPIHQTCERTRVSCRGEDPRSPGRQEVG